jgi:phospholipase/carboxylesterase
MHEARTRLAGLQTCLIEGIGAAQLRVVFLHGYNMRASDLTPFAHSLSIPGVAYAFPQAETQVSAAGYAWWPAVGPRAADQPGPARDLWEVCPVGRDSARRQISELVAALRARTGEAVVLAGFSQGGMLACDCVLMDQTDVVSLVMMSASCISFREWYERRARLRGLPTFISHGRSDADLAFTAGQRLASFCSDSGASLSWVPFEGGHEIPFPVWKGFKQFLRNHLTDRSRTFPHAYAAQ